MKSNLLKTGIILIFMVSVINASAREYRLGGGAIYNMKTKGVGLDARVEFPLKKLKLLEGLSIVPQVSFYPAFNEVSEFYAGTSVHLGVYRVNKWIFYGLANISYNGWINYEDSDDENARFSYPAIEGGFGITRKKCIRPFMELRLNAIGFEPTLRVGLLYTFNCDRRGAVPCSKIPPQPVF